MQNRDERGRFKHRINPAAAVITLAAVASAIYLYGIKPLIRPAHAAEYPVGISAAADAIVRNAATATWDDRRKDADSAKEYHLADPEMYAKWIQSLDRKIEGLELRLGDPKVILRNVCRDNGLSGSECPRTLYGMAMQESVLGTRMVGDGGKSEGWFHIMYYHNVPDSCSHDLACSADWTLKRMMRFGFGENPEATKVAIMKHNGTPYIAATIAYFKAVQEKGKAF